MPRVKETSVPMLLMRTQVLNERDAVQLRIEAARLRAQAKAYTNAANKLDPPQRRRKK